MRRSLCTAAVLCVALVAGAGAARADAVVHHVAPAEADEGAPLRLSAVIDDAWALRGVVARYRPADAADAAPWREVAFERSSTGEYYAVIPGAAVRRPGVVYYVVGVGEDGGERPAYASAESPHEVRVDPPASQRWIEVERARLGGRVDRVGASFEAVSFGDDLGETDHYLRAEVAWTHRTVRTLYSFTLGYGFVEGRTPDDIRAPDVSGFSTRGARYGFGSVRLRAHEKLWIDGGVSLGFSHDGFAAGVRGALTIGRPWRSCVSLGLDVMQDLGGTYWVQLQWDTAPPFLMWARIASTELPGEAGERGGMLTWHVDYPITPRISVGAQLTAGARERHPIRPGAGLSLDVEF
jgi:hypothetical protein